MKKLNKPTTMLVAFAIAAAMTGCGKDDSLLKILEVAFMISMGIRLLTLGYQADCFGQTEMSGHPNRLPMATISLGAKPNPRQIILNTPTNMGVMKTRPNTIQRMARRHLIQKTTPPRQIGVLNVVCLQGLISESYETIVLGYGSPITTAQVVTS